MDYLKEESGVRSISKMYNQNSENLASEKLFNEGKPESHGDTQH